ncbi:formate dehydrogenase-N subunit alpha [Evansella sp. LMS18]|nr:formate dehydrogenase-N subunit alpha [Evansella sp. LMS18]
MGTSYGRGGATSTARDLQDADCIVIMGSNFAENHPVGFRFVLRARDKGAKVLHIDPRFTRTSAMSSDYVPMRSGTDIAFIGALINYVIQNDKFFKEYVVNYTNAPFIVKEEYKDTEDLEGIFSGFDPDKKAYDNASWAYEREDPVEPEGEPANLSERLAREKLAGRPKRDETLQHPRSVFQLMKKHYSRYTPEMVEEICGTSKEEFLMVAKTVTANSNAERTTTFCYAMGWTQHTYGVQTIRSGAILQGLLGNMGRPGGGILALRGHANVQGATDLSTLWNSLPGYLDMPAKGAAHDTLEDFLRDKMRPTSFWQNYPKYLVSILKAWYGDAATPANDFAYEALPKTLGNHSHYKMFEDAYNGIIKGMMVIGQNPAVGGQNASFHRKALGKLDWLVVKDPFLIETATFWYEAPEVKNGSVKAEDIGTEVFYMPSTVFAETEGSFTNTSRLLQTKEKAADPPGDCRSDLWFTYELGKRLKELYKDSNAKRDWGFNHLTWDYEPDVNPRFKIQEPSEHKIVKEINGYDVATGAPVGGFGDLQDDGSTACGCWIYSGVLPEESLNRAANREGDDYQYLNWGFAWPANRRNLYNRASARPDGKPWSERKKYIWWDAAKEEWTGYDVPDFAATKAPDTPAVPGGVGLAAQSGKDPFLMNPDGVIQLFAPAGLADGPLPTHYEPPDTPVSKNILYPDQTFSPTAVIFEHLPNNKVHGANNSNYPFVITTYRVTEHHLSGAMTRWLPWLAELMPELFLEISPELASELGVQSKDFVTVETGRGKIEARALVTKRMRPLKVEGKMVHTVGMPIHWGYSGVATGSVPNDLSAIVADPNVYIHSSKAFTCNVKKGRLPGGVV